MKTRFDAYFLQKEEPVRGCLLALKKIILDFDSNLTPEWKYGMPAFYWKGKPFCYLWTDKKTEMPYVLFVDGNQLDHPLLEAGSRAKMKVFYVDASTDIPLEVLHELLAAAVRLKQK